MIIFCGCVILELSRFFGIGSLLGNGLVYGVGSSLVIYSRGIWVGVVGGFGGLFRFLIFDFG